MTSKIQICSINSYVFGTELLQRSSGQVERWNGEVPRDKYSTFVLKLPDRSCRTCDLPEIMSGNFRLCVDKTCLWDKIHSARKKAEVAELADALRSGRSEGYLMRVQVPPSAQEDHLERLAKSGSFWLSPGQVIPGPAMASGCHRSVEDARLYTSFTPIPVFLRRGSCQTGFWECINLPLEGESGLQAVV